MKTLHNLMFTFLILLPAITYAEMPLAVVAAQALSGAWQRSRRWVQSRYRK